MVIKFNCPRCGGANDYTGEGNTIRCQFCGSNVHPPEDMISQAAQARFSSKAKVWIIIFIMVVFVLPTCIGFGGTLIGIATSIIGTLVGIFASFWGG